MRTRMVVIAPPPINWPQLPTKLYSLLLTRSEGGESEGSEGEGGSGWDFDFNLNRISRRVNHAFFPHWDGPPPFVSIHFIHLILVVGLLISLLFLVLALIYHTMQKLRGLCPSFKLCRRHDFGGFADLEGGFAKELPTPEILEARRQERLFVLQKECELLETQLTHERNTSLTSRASDSDLEYLGYGEDSPPLKRNSISLQDIPQSVIKIRREKQLRQLKEEIEHLHALSQSQDLDKVFADSSSSKSPLLKDLHFNFLPRSKSNSPSPVLDPPTPVTTEHLSQRIAHLKAQRRLQEIRSDLEGLALHHLHSDEIKAKTSSLQDLPKTALGAKRKEELLTIAKEIEHVKSYKLQQKSIISSVLPERHHESNKERTTLVLAKMNQETQQSPTTFPAAAAAATASSSLQRQASEISEVSSVVGSSFAPSASLRRTRAQELNRVRVELKELSYKLNLNYVFDVEGDRQKMVPSDWPKHCSFISRDNSFGK